MARHEVAKALEALSDESLRQQVAQGDLSGLLKVYLSEEEQGLLVGAAADYPETEDFAFEVSLKRRPGEVNLSGFGEFGKAVEYCFELRPFNPRAVPA